eukprot:tig00000133_g7708.t1
MKASGSAAGLTTLAGISVAASVHFVAWITAARYGAGASIWPFHPAVLPQEDFARTVGAAVLSAALVCLLVAAVHFRPSRRPWRASSAEGTGAGHAEPRAPAAGAGRDSLGRHLILSNAATVATIYIAANSIVYGGLARPCNVFSYAFPGAYVS